MSVEQTLAQLEELNKKAQVHNQKQLEIKGSKKARIQSILAEVEVLNSLGYVLKMELQSETEFTAESIQAYKELAAKIKAEKESQIVQLERFFEAVEKKDFDTIKEITGEDVSVVSYEVDVESSKSVKEQAKSMTEGILESGVETASSKVSSVEAPKKEEVSEVEVSEVGSVSEVVKEEETPTTSDQGALDLLSGAFSLETEEESTPTEVVSLEVNEDEPSDVSNDSEDAEVDWASQFMLQQ